MGIPGEVANERTLSVLEEIYQTKTNANVASSRPQSRLHGKLRWDRVRAPFAIAVGIFALLVGVVQVRSNIHFPTSVLPQLRTGGLRDLQERLDLSFQAAGITDTDGDGILDADETATYGSSPYLEDTDSDGISDADEVKAKTDPTCPTGQTCGVGASPAGQPAAVPSPVAPSLLGNPPAAIERTPDPGAVAPYSGTAFDADKIRGQLLGSGVSAELLSSFSDEQLATVFQEAVREQAGGTGISVPGAAGSLPVPGLPTTAELRSLLVQQGLPKSTADQLTDEQLQQLMQEVLKDLPAQPEGG